MREHSDQISKSTSRSSADPGISGQTDGREAYSPIEDNKTETLKQNILQKAVDKSPKTQFAAKKSEVVNLAHGNMSPAVTQFLLFADIPLDAHNNLALKEIKEISVWFKMASEWHSQKTITKIDPTVADPLTFLASASHVAGAATKFVKDGPIRMSLHGGDKGQIIVANGMHLSAKSKKEEIAAAYKAKCGEDMKDDQFHPQYCTVGDPTSPFKAKYPHLGAGNTIAPPGEIKSLDGNNLDKTILKKHWTGGNFINEEIKWKKVADANGSSPKLDAYLANKETTKDTELLRAALDEVYVQVGKEFELLVEALEKHDAEASGKVISGHAPNIWGLDPIGK